MSEPRFVILLSDHARRDIRDILVYTQEVWGTAQRLSYKEKIQTAVAALALNPRSNRQKYGLYVSAFGRHLIFYEIKERAVFVVRILHERMDAPEHL